MIEWVKGKGWMVKSHSGRNLGVSKTRAAAEKRLKQVEMFKHIDAMKGRKK